jgi:hypothetical protein
MTSSSVLKLISWFERAEFSCVEQLRKNSETKKKVNRYTRDARMDKLLNFAKILRQ